jgi:hypothetical protein
MEKDGPLDGRKYNENNKDNLASHTKKNFKINLTLYALLTRK